ncbi:tyrosine--tRNA ligase [Candidatus Odyssella acanthamoebae]|uniref:Tyrosine--tRNA ligase n=1 Tax=Candidatus Odyssella acanthamoebae TaxID=91604 RepID=A0A077AUK9_9PROT|nr:tyrosine--tRNA ligase [Candidatus Paracaedibacter acanthamoebae]AIK95719.1 tyrosyl-tRNA synthetase [Candidatus Paracaedibacter acanthamoebae]
MKSEFLQILNARGFIHQATDMEALKELFSNQTVTAYIGFDATANSLHVGSLVQIMMLRWLQKCGHRPLVLMGGGTSKIGDPSGKDEARSLVTDETIQTNIEGISKVFKKFLTFGTGPHDAIMVNNDDWLKDLNYISFLRDYGRHFSVNRMLTFDSVKLRLEREQSLSLLEFNYMILQAYDFLELNQRLGCTLQMGGSDQWGNIVNGVELTRRVIAKEVFGLTSPLITTSSGAKMGKTASGAIWLNGDRLPAYDYWQFWRNTEDADVGRYLRLFTEIDLNEIEKLEQLQGAEINHAKKVLADAATALAHGAEALPPIHEAIAQLFEHGNSGDLSSLPSLEISPTALDAGVPILDLFVQLNLVASKGEARRLIQGNGAKINDMSISDPLQLITIKDLNGERMIKLSAGKKRHGIVKVE